MIRALGIDTVEIDRFVAFIHYQDNQLYRIFSSQEITYCRSTPAKSAERFAVRFAAKEAFFKAFWQLGNPASLPLFSVARQVSVTLNPAGVPKLAINWQALGLADWHDLVNHLSLTHSRLSATACVIISGNCSKMR
jgi:holo-[acyl-carrier protein] synthase